MSFLTLTLFTVFLFYVYSICWHGLCLQDLSFVTWTWFTGFVLSYGLGLQDLSFVAWTLFFVTWTLFTGFVFSGMDFVRICLSWHGLCFKELFNTKVLVTFRNSWCFWLSLQDQLVFDMVFVYKNAFDFLYRICFWCRICLQECFYLFYRICLMWYLFTRMLLTFLTGFVFDVLFVYKNAFDFLFRICFWCGICLQECFWLFYRICFWFRICLQECFWLSLQDLSLMSYLFTRMHLNFLTGFVWYGICLQECLNYLSLQDLSWLMQGLMCG